MDIGVHLGGFSFGLFLGMYGGTILNWGLFGIAVGASVWARRMWMAPLAVAVLLLPAAVFSGRDADSFLTTLGFCLPIAVYASLFHLWAVGVWRLLTQPGSSSDGEVRR